MRNSPRPLKSDPQEGGPDSCLTQHPEPSGNPLFHRNRKPRLRECSHLSFYLSPVAQGINVLKGKTVLFHSSLQGWFLPEMVNAENTLIIKCSDNIGKCSFLNTDSMLSICWSKNWKGKASRSLSVAVLLNKEHPCKGTWSPSCCPFFLQ